MKSTQRIYIGEHTVLEYKERIGNVDAAIEVINCSEFGLSAGVITKDDAVADQFIREVNADEIFVNDPSIIIGAASKAKVANFLD